MVAGVFKYPRYPSPSTPPPSPTLRFYFQSNRAHTNIHQRTRTLTKITQCPVGPSPLLNLTGPDLIGGTVSIHSRALNGNHYHNSIDCDGTALWTCFF